MGGSDHCPCVTLPLPSSLPPSLPPQPPYPYQEVMPKLTPRTRVLYAFGEVRPARLPPPQPAPLPSSLLPLASLAFRPYSRPSFPSRVPSLRASLPPSLPQQSPAQDLDLINRAINRRGCEASSSLPHNGEGREAGNGGRWEGREKSQKKLKL